MQPSPQGRSGRRRYLELLVSSTVCPWAQEARGLEVVVNPHTRDVSGLGDALRDLGAAGTDDVVLAVLHHDYEPTVGLLSQTLNALLRHIAEYAGNTRAFDEVGSVGWDFAPFGQPLFVVVLGSCYAPSHPRSIPLQRTTIILFQSEGSFRRRGISSTSKGRVALSNSVARRFRRQGRPYDAAELRRTPKCERYLLPQDLTRDRIQWWRSE